MESQELPFAPCDLKTYQRSLRIAQEGGRSREEEAQYGN